MIYLIKVKTKSGGSITFTEHTNDLQQAKCNVTKRMMAAGWGYMSTIEVKERYAGRIEVR